MAWDLGKQSADACKELRAVDFDANCEGMAKLFLDGLELPPLVVAAGQADASHQELDVRNAVDVLDPLRHRQAPEQIGGDLVIADMGAAAGIDGGKYRIGTTTKLVPRSS